MLTVTSQYEAWSEYFRGVRMSANLGKRGLAVSTRKLAQKHAIEAAKHIARHFNSDVRDNVQWNLENWMAAHLTIAEMVVAADSPDDQAELGRSLLKLKDQTRDLAHLLVLSAGSDPKSGVTPLQTYLDRTVEAYVELLAAKVEKDAVVTRKASKEAKDAWEAAARCAVEWFL